MDSARGAIYLGVKALQRIPLSQIRTTGVASVLISSRWVVHLLSIKLVEDHAVDTLHIGFFYSPLPDIVECRIEQLLTTMCIDLINECDVSAMRKYQSKLFIGSREDVINAVLCTINDLNVFHG